MKLGEKLKMNIDTFEANVRRQREIAEKIAADQQAQVRKKRSSLMSRIRSSLVDQIDQGNRNPIVNIKDRNDIKWLNECQNGNKSSVDYDVYDTEIQFWSKEGCNLKLVEDWNYDDSWLVAAIELQ